MGFEFSVYTPSAWQIEDTVTLSRSSDDTKQNQLCQQFSHAVYLVALGVTRPEECAQRLDGRLTLVLAAGVVWRMMLSSAL